MGREHVTAALDRRDEAGGDLIVVHTPCQSINRCLPLRMMNFSGNSLVSNDPCVVLCERYEDEYSSAVLCAGNPAQQKLFERGPMCSGALYRAWNERQPQRHRQENQHRDDQEKHNLKQKDPLDAPLREIDERPWETQC